MSYCYNIKDKFCLKIWDSYLQKNKSNGCVKNGMVYNENAKIINTWLTISMILYNWHETLSSTESLVYTGHRRNLAKWPNCILICSADQRKTRVTKYYKLVVILKKFIREKRLWNNDWVMLNLWLTVYIQLHICLITRVLCVKQK